MYLDILDYLIAFIPVHRSSVDNSVFYNLLADNFNAKSGIRCSISVFFCS